MAKPASNPCRYERKYLANGQELASVHCAICLHRAMFRQTYPPRHVNNIYYDSLSRHAYYGNVDGNADRTKIRLRWYGDLLGKIHNPILEFKMKRSLLGYKRSYPAKPFELKAFPDPIYLPEISGCDDLPEALRCLLKNCHPVIMNCYRRHYFISADNRFRITTDTDLQYYRVSRFGNTFNQVIRNRTTVLIELKYDQQHESIAHQIAGELPFRLTRNSKYINAIDFHSLSCF